MRRPLRYFKASTYDVVLEDGTHPMYMETRFNETTKKSMAHGVFLLK